MGNGPEPTNADLAAAIKALGTDLTDLRSEVRVISLEQRAGHAELKADLAELRLQISDLGTSLRDLWTEHLGHHHPEAG